jgi:hypothetical protein
MNNLHIYKINLKKMYLMQKIKVYLVKLLFFERKWIVSLDDIPKKDTKWHKKCCSLGIG